VFQSDKSFRINQFPVEAQEKPAPPAENECAAFLKPSLGNPREYAAQAPIPTLELEF